MFARTGPIPLPSIAQFPTYFSTDVKQAILDTPYTHGTTNTAAALRYVADTMYTSNNGYRSNVADLVVILTDGGSNDQEATVTQGLRLKVNMTICTALAFKF